MSSIGLNFRANAGYVTDGAGETYVVGDVYPTSRGGWTFGWETTGALTLDRDNAGDPRLAGLNYAPTAQRTFRLDLPASGDYIVRAAFGDAASGQSVPWLLKDDSTTFASTTGLSGGANQFKDATDVNRTSQADWGTNNASVLRTFGSTILRLVSNDNGQNVVIAHLYVEQDGGGGASFIAYPRPRGMNAGMSVLSGGIA